MPLPLFLVLFMIFFLPMWMYKHGMKMFKEHMKKQDGKDTHLYYLLIFLFILLIMALIWESYVHGF